jgi:hypothetical protein
VTTPSDIIAKLRAVGAVQRYRVNFDGSLYKHATGDIVEYGEVADLIEAAPALADVVEAAQAALKRADIIGVWPDGHTLTFSDMESALARLTDQSADGRGVEG